MENIPQKLKQNRLMKELSLIFLLNDNSGAKLDPSAAEKSRGQSLQNQA